MCRAQTAPLLVMDVEGTDGRERGEDQDFERKSALFSLASSEVSGGLAHREIIDPSFHRSSLSIYGSIKLVSTKARTWVS